MDRHAAVVIVVFMLAGWPGLAQAGQAQEAGGRPPVVELGAGALARVDGAPSSLAAGVRVRFNVTPRTALELTSDWHTRRVTPSPYNWSYADTIAVQLRRALWQSGNTEVFGTVGAGVETSRHHFSGYAYGPAGRGFAVPGFDAVDRRPMVLGGAGISRRVTSVLAVQADAQVTVTSEHLGMRVIGGVSVPLGRYPARRSGRPGTSVAGSRLASALKPGRTIWVTTVDGQEITGQLANVDGDGLDVSTRAGRVAIPFVDVRRIEVPDPIANGTKIGAITGAAAAAIPVGIFVAVLCEAEGCSGGSQVGVTLAMAGLGAGIGAVAGAIVDSFHERRHVAYEGAAGAASWQISPVLARRGAGLGAVIRW